MHFVAEPIYLRDNQWEDDPTVMKFGARYEILRALTRGDVETFAVRDRTTDEKALAHIFECPEPPPDQPTIQWILAAFSRLVSEAPGIVTGAGRYDVAGFAYVVSRWTTDEEVEEWARNYKDGTSSAEPSSVADSSDTSSNQKPQARPSFSPESLQAIGDSSVEKSETQTGAHQPGAFTQQFFGGMAFPGDSVAAESLASAQEREKHSEERPIASSVSGARLGEPLAGTPLRDEPQEPALRNPGDFTAQFFREINAPLEPPAKTSNSFSAEGEVKLDPANVAPTPGKPAVGAGDEDWARDKKPGSFTDQFMRDFGPAIPRAEPYADPAERPAKIETGEFTKLFRAPIVPAEESKSSTFEERPGERKSSTGEFTRMFGRYGPGAAGEAGFPSAAGEPEAASTSVGSTGLFGEQHVSDRPIGEDPYRATSASVGRVQDGGATQAFAGRRESQEHPEAVPAHEPITGPVLSKEPILDSSHFNAVDGGATVLFHAPAEVPIPGEAEQPAGPSDYTMFMNRDAVSALVSGSAEGPPLSGATPAAPPAAVSSPALTPPVVAPPAMPSYPAPAVPVAAPPAIPSYQAPVAPAVPPPAMPAVAPPAVAAPSVSAPAGQASGKPKSYLPLIIVLNVLFVLAVLLILYFVLRQ